MEVVTATEKPLNPGAKAALMAGAAATIFLFYALSVVAIVLLAGVIVILLALLLAAFRFGGAGVIIPILTRHVELMQIILQSFWLRKGGIEFRLPLHEEDAPELFRVLQELADKLQIAPPQVVQLEMGLTAWVQLKGLRQGKGQTILGVGYDLLAGLSKDEMEGVLAHELTHAKLIQRGLKGWLTAGLNRLIKLSNQLAAVVDAYQRADRGFIMAEGLAKVSSALTRLAARQISAYSRQDEFEADRGAAELCGAIKIRSSLMKLDSLEEITSQLPWKERVARLQLEGGYSRWLRQELAQADSRPRKEKTEILSQYSTHPIMKDRLAALPDDGSVLSPDQEPAIDLLANPDDVADKLVVEIQKKQAEAEEEDSKELKKWTRKARGGGNAQPIQVLGLLLMIIGGALLVCMLYRDLRTLPVFVFVLFFAGSGYWVYWLGRYKDKTSLPVPTYSGFFQAWRKVDEIKDFAAEQKAVESACLQLVSGEKKKKKRALILARESYASLERGDYLRAHVTSRLCLDANPEMVEGVTAGLIAAAAFGFDDQVNWALRRLKQMTGLNTTETAWSAGWALILLGDWTHAEAFLDQALAKRPLEASWRMLLALAQARRGKLQNGIKNAREACALMPEDEEAAKLFINMLLEGGYFREAQERLDALQHKLNEDTDLIFAQVKALLIRQDIEKANEWAEYLKAKAANAQIIVRLGESYEEARQHDHAVGCYNRALEQGYYPAAFVGMGRIEALRQNEAVARTYFFSALEMNRPLGEKALGSLGVLHETVNHLLQMHEPSLHCRAWIATLTNSALPAELANQSFLVYARDRVMAEQYFEAVIGALRKGMPPLLPSALIWREASKAQQPDGPVRPGVQGIFN